MAVSVRVCVLVADYNKSHISMSPEQNGDSCGRFLPIGEVTKR